ncbi:MAG: hypothetical protein ACI81R_001019 [Bradymonadia bacterium]
MSDTPETATSLSDVEASADDPQRPIKPRSSVLDRARVPNRAATIRGALIVLLLIALSLSWRARSADAGAQEAAELAITSQRAGEDASGQWAACEERRDVCLGTLNGLGRPLSWIGHECIERCVNGALAEPAEVDPTVD